MPSGVHGARARLAERDDPTAWFPECLHAGCASLEKRKAYGAVRRLASRSGADDSMRMNARRLTPRTARRVPVG
jgi:hypothetical protein